MVVSAYGLSGQHAPPLVGEDSGLDGGHVPNPHLRMEGRIVKSWEMNLRLMNATSKDVQVAVRFLTIYE